MAEEWDSVARRRGVSFGDVLWLAWEITSQWMLEEARGINEPDPSRPEYRPTYEPCLPEWYEEVPPVAVSDLPRRLNCDGVVDKEQLALKLPQRVHKAINDLAAYEDESLSKRCQRVYLRARPYLLAWRDASPPR
jgi:hypothetical protein